MAGDKKERGEKQKQAMPVLSSAQLMVLFFFSIGLSLCVILEGF
jgi:hypothetical protein